MDLFICYMLKKIIFDTDEGQQILTDQNGLSYFVIRNIPYSGHLSSVNTESTYEQSESKITDG